MWWQYLLDKPCNIRKFFCRIRNHPGGVTWYNLSGLEPDMRCINCGDNLG